jgi:hypothetical protein
MQNKTDLQGVEQIRSEMNDPTEPLIDGTYGYGSQSLINLMLTGRAVGHVWDHDQDVGGLSKCKSLYYKVNASATELITCTLLILKFRCNMLNFMN